MNCVVVGMKLFLIFRPGSSDMCSSASWVRLVRSNRRIGVPSMLMKKVEGGMKFFLSDTDVQSWS